MAHRTEGHNWGTWNFRTNEKMVAKLVERAEKIPEMVAEYETARRESPYCFSDGEGFADFVTEDGYTDLFCEVLNRTKFGGEDVFAGGRFIGVAAKTMVELALSKEEVEKSIQEFLEELGEPQELKFKWEYYDSDAPNACEF